MATLSMLFSSLFRRGRKYLFSVFAILLLLIGPAFLSAPPEITPEIDRTLTKMAEYFALGYDRLSPYLKETGYVQREGTEKWPVIRQLYEAYRQTATIEDGGKFLAMLAQRLAREHISVKEDNNIMRYWQPGEQIERPQWNPPNSPMPSTDLPPEVKGCLVAMGEYMEGGALGGTTGILKNILNLPNEKVFEFQIRSNSYKEAVVHGLQFVSKNDTEMKSNVGEIASHVFNNYQSAREIPEIKDALSWRIDRTKQVLEWEGIPLDDKKIDRAKGFNIDMLATRIYMDSTKLGIEIVPDINISSIKIVISPAFSHKKTPPGFYSTKIDQLTNLSKSEKLNQIYMIEKEMRKVLSESAEIIPDPYSFFEAKAVPFMDNQGKLVNIPLTKDDVWKSFRHQFPFHIQTIEQSPRNSAGTYFVLIAEPPPHTTLESIKAQFNGHVISWEEKKNQIGYDGWAKDLILEIKTANDAEMDTFYHRLYRHLFFVEPHRKPLNLSVQEEPVYFSMQNLNYEIQSIYLEHWLLGEKALGFTPLNKQNAEAQTLSQIFKKNPTGVWITQNPLLVAWILPFGITLDGKQSEIREFAESVDLIIGAIRIEDNVAIIARKRIIPESVLPTMRTETILALASSPYNGLAQSYERNFLWAGKGHDNFDWAPIYLSATLQNTDFGSLLNIADQMLKSWSLNGTIEYKNFIHKNPTSWAFPQPLDDVLGTMSITFNGNMNGATQLFEFSNHHDFKKLTIINVSRTGAMSIMYKPEDIYLDSVQIYEEKAWKYFSELGSPIWAQNVRYAALFQVFKNFEIKSHPFTSGLSKPLDFSSLQNKTYNFLIAIDSLNKRGIQEFVSNCISQDHPNKFCKEQNLFRLLMRIKNGISEIKMESDTDGLKKIAQMVGNPGELLDNPTNLLAEKVKRINEDFEQLKHFPSVFDLLGFNFGQIMENHSRQNEPISGAWIKTPVVVASKCNSFSDSSTGGHNVSTSGLSFRVGKTSEIVEFYTNRYTKNGVIVAVPEPIYARLTPELIRRFEKAIEFGDRESIKKELRAIY